MTTQQSPDNGLGKLFSKKLHGSMLDEKAAKHLRFKLVDSSHAPDWLTLKAGGFTIPYFDLDGKPTSFQRFRYLEQPARNGFDAVVEHKPLRYAQAPKSLNEIYLPPFAPWAKLAEQPDVPIIITEGEIKAAAVMKNSARLCIGLGGVWCFKSKKNSLQLLPQFKLFKWKDRKVYIIYDSDAATNPDIIAAENALARELMALGAVPHIARIPPNGPNKIGLDDFIYAEGIDAIDDLQKRAVVFKPAEELFKLNEEVIYVRDPGLILRLDTLQKLTAKAFVEHAFSTRIYTVTSENAKHEIKTEEKSAPREWLKWPNRAEAAKMTYAPGAPRVTAKGEFNLWRGWGCEPKKGDVSPWKKLLDHLFGGNGPARQWFERWLACPFQKPGVKQYCCALLHGRMHGTGKSFIGYSVGKLYGVNWAEIKDKDLHSDHNEWAENKQFIMGDEITGGDKRGEADRMKGIITQQQLRLNPKYIPSYSVPDCLSYYFTSNHPDAFFLEDDDRRNFIWEVLAAPLPFSFYTEYEDWIGAPNVVGPGAPALFHHLLTLDMGDYDPRAKAPMTESKQAMISNNRSDVGEWVATLKLDPDTVLRWNNEVIKHCLFSSEDLLTLYDPERKGKVTANGMTRELRRAGFRQVYSGQSVPTRWGFKRLWVMRQIPGRLHNATGELLGKFYDDERTVKTTPRKEKFK